MAGDKHESLQFLQEYKHIAIVGISINPSRPSNYVAHYLQSVGYDIIPVNPNYVGQTVLGKHIYPSLTEARKAGEPIEIVDVFRRSQYVLPIAEEAIRVGAKVLWLQMGVRNDKAAQEAEEAGLIVIQDRCIKIEHALYFSR